MSVSQHFFPFFTLFSPHSSKAVPPDTRRCCSVAAWLSLTQRRKHKRAVKLSELETDSCTVRTEQPDHLKRTSVRSSKQAWLLRWLPEKKQSQKIHQTVAFVLGLDFFFYWNVSVKIWMKCLKHIKRRWLKQQRRLKINCVVSAGRIMFNHNYSGIFSLLFHKHQFLDWWTLINRNFTDILL